MGLIDPRDTLAISDRIGKRYYFTLLSAVSGSPLSSSVRGDTFYAMCHICPDGDPDVEITTLNNANSSDTAWNESSDAMVIATSMMASMSSSYSIINAITSHINTATSGGTRLITGGWNQYLETADPTGTIYATIPTLVSAGTGVRVSEYFRRVAANSGVSNLRARNVFYDNPDAFNFALITGAGGTAISVDILGDFGNGTVNDLANGSKFAATRMKLVVPDGSKWDDATTFDLTLVTEPDGTPVVESVSVPGGMVAGDYVYVGLDDTYRFVKVTSITRTAGNTTLGDTLNIQNVFERVIEL